MSIVKTDLRQFTQSYPTGEDVVDGRFHQAFSTQLDGIEVVLVVDTQLSGEEIASVEQAVARFATELDQVAGSLG